MVPVEDKSKAQIENYEIKQNDTRRVDDQPDKFMDKPGQENETGVKANDQPANFLIREVDEELAAR